MKKILGQEKSKQVIDHLGSSLHIKDSDVRAIKSLHGAFRMYSPWNAEHSVRVGLHLANFATIQGYSATDSKRLGLSACLHDIGKLRVSSQLLDKADTLEDEERDIIQDHVQDADRCLDFLSREDRDKARLLIRNHHENYDGSGYPDRMTGNETPDIVQMIRICDFYDAVIFDRPYRAGVGQPGTLHLMDKVRHFFNPQLLESFKANIDRIDQIPEFA